VRVFQANKLALLLDDPTIKSSGVAKVARISPQTLAAIKQGEQEPKANTLVALADALQKPLDYFFEEE
jgi:transcriptional regulator with XRE-family HTH domain